MPYLNFILFVLLCGCTWEFQKPPQDISDRNRTNFGSIFGERIIIHGKKTTKKETTQKSQVNKFLWEGALKVIDFMPIIKANPERGRIVTDWHMDPKMPKIRTRVLVIIIGKELRADGVQVIVQRQRQNKAKEWQDIPFPKSRCHQIEMLIIQKARTLRNQILNKGHKEA